MKAGLKKLFLLALLAAICYGIYIYFFTEETVSYGLTTSQITRGDITSKVTATGELNALNVVQIGTQVSGTIKEIYVDFNSPVRAGQLIALIDPSVLQLTLKESEASLSAYQASVQSAKALLTDSERNYARTKELFNQKLISKSEVDTSAADVSMKRASLQEAKSRVAQARAAVERARTNLNYTKITSPINGVVIDRQVDAGQTVAASLQTPTLFKIAEDLTKMQIETKVDEADIGTVAEGQNVTFKVDAFPDETFYGKIKQVRVSPESSNNVVTYKVIIHFDNSELKLKPGMTANVSIETARAKNVLRIPVAALRFTPPEDLLNTISFDREILTQKKTLNSGILWLEQDETTMTPLKVKTGISDNTWVELDGEEEILSEGTELIINAEKGVKIKKQRQMREGGGRVLGAPRVPRGLNAGRGAAR